MTITVHSDSTLSSATQQQNFIYNVALKWQLHMVCTKSNCRGTAHVT